MANVRDLLLIQGPADLEHVLAGHPGLAERCECVPLSLAAEAALVDAGLPATAPWPFLASWEYRDLLEDAQESIYSWTRGLPAESRWRNVDIAAADGETYRLAFFQGTLLGAMLDRLFAERPGAAVTIAGGLSRPAFWYEDNDVATAVAAWKARTAGRNVRILRRPDERPFRGMMRPCADEAAVEEALRTVERVRGERPLVIILAHGFGGAREYADLLARRGGMAVALLRFAGARLVGGVGGPPEETGVVEVPFGMPAGRPMPAAIAGHFAAAAKAFAEWQRGYDGPYSHILANPFLDYQFRYYFDAHWPAAAWLYDTVLAMLDRLRPDGVMVPDLKDLEVEVTALAARERSIPLIAGLHAGWSNGFTIYRHATQALLWCEAQVANARMLHRLYASDRGEPAWTVTGSLPLYRESAAAKPDTGALRRTLGIPEGRRIVLVVLNVTDVNGVPRAAPEALRQSFATLLRVPDDLAGQVHLVVKTKPRFAGDPIYRSAPGSDPSAITEVADVPLPALAALCDVMVMVSAASSAALTAVYAGRPVVWLDSVPFFFNIRTELPKEGVAYVTADAALWPRLRRLLFDADARRRELARQQAYWAATMPMDDPSGRIVDAVRTTIAAAGRSALPAPAVQRRRAEAPPADTYATPQRPVRLWTTRAFTGVDRAHRRADHYTVLAYANGVRTLIARGFFRSTSPAPPFTARMVIGRGSTLGIGSYAKFDNQEHGPDTHTLRIGHHLSCGWNVRFVLGGMHRTEQLSITTLEHLGIRSRGLRDVGNLEIGNDAWIGDEAMILGGCRIGDGCAIGSRSLVPPHSVLEPYGVYAGSPARLLRFRYPETLIDLVRKVEWWARPPEWIAANHDLFTMDLNADPVRSAERLQAALADGPALEQEPLDRLLLLDPLSGDPVEPAGTPGP